MRLLLLLLAVISSPGQRPSDVVSWTAAAPGSWTIAGGTLEIVATAKVERGWKLYALDQLPDGPKPLSFAVSSPFTLLSKRITAPPAKVLEDPLFDTKTRYYEHEVSIRVPVAIPADLAGIHQIPLEVTFQACGGEICLRPFTQKLPVTIEVRR